MKNIRLKLKTEKYIKVTKNEKPKLKNENWKLNMEKDKWKTKKHTILNMKWKTGNENENWRITNATEKRKV